MVLVLSSLIVAITGLKCKPCPNSGGSSVACWPRDKPMAPRGRAPPQEIPPGHLHPHSSSSTTSFPTQPRKEDREAGPFFLMEC